MVKPPRGSTSDLNADKPDPRAHAIAAGSTNKEHLHESEAHIKVWRDGSAAKLRTQRTWVQLPASMLGGPQEPVISAPGALTPSPGLLGHLYSPAQIHKYTHN